MSFLKKYTYGISNGLTPSWNWMIVCLPIFRMYIKLKICNNKIFNENIVRYKMIWNLIIFGAQVIRFGLSQLRKRC